MFIHQHNLSLSPTKDIPRVAWSSLPALSPLTGSTIPGVGRRFFIHSPTTILKLGVHDGEDVMTALAHSILGPSLVPGVVSVVTLSLEASTPVHIQRGLVLTRMPGTPLSELWPELSLEQREAVKRRLCVLLVRMRAPRFDYYGRPMGQPYVLVSSYGQETHAHCTSRLQWDDSRIRALHAPPGPPPIQDPSEHEREHLRALETVQRETNGGDGWDRPVLTHGDLSERNILVDRDTLEVTGLIDWEMANIMPAYSEYAAARLLGGHLPEWRKELLEVLREVLRRECVLAEGGQEQYKRVLTAWDAIVDVERIAQGYSDDCAWTFETGYEEST